MRGFFLSILVDNVDKILYNIIYMKTEGKT